MLEPSQPLPQTKKPKTFSKLAMLSKRDHESIQEMGAELPSPIEEGTGPVPGKCSSAVGGAIDAVYAPTSAGNEGFCQRAPREHMLAPTSQEGQGKGDSPRPSGNPLQMAL